MDGEVLEDDPLPSPGGTRPSTVFSIPLAWILLLGLLCVLTLARLLPRWIQPPGGEAAVNEPLVERPRFLVNVNTASSAELQALPEIGTALADRIVAYRREVGEFQEIEHLQEVRGFGPKRLEQLRELVTVRSEP